MLSSVYRTAIKKNEKIIYTFALLSVGLSASAQTYTLELRSNYAWEEIANSWDLGEIKPNEPLRKLIHLEYDEEEEITYNEVVLLKKDSEDDEGVELGARVFYLGQYSTGWYDITFTYDPSSDWNYFRKQDNSDGKYLNIEDGVTTIHLSDDITIGNGGYVNAIDYTRSCTNKWGTLCLPFEIYAHQDDVTFYELKSATSDALIFSPTTSFSFYAGMPIVFKLNDGVSNLVINNLDNNGINIIKRQQQQSSADGSWTLNGTIEETTIANGWVMQSNEIREVAEDGFPIKPYRVWFSGERPSGAPLRIEVDDTEGLQFVEQEDGTVKVSYDLQGRKLDDARKGLMIENGKVIMVK